MSIKKLSITALICAALFALPLAASAGDYPAFLNMSGVVKGTAKVTWTSMSADGTKKVPMVVALTGGTLTKEDGTEAIIFDNVNHTAALSLDLTGFADKDGVPAVVYAWGDGLLQTGNSLSGPGGIFVAYPSDDYISSHAGTGKQYIIFSAARVIATGKNDKGKTTGKGVIKASKATAAWAGFANYTSDGNGDVSWGGEYLIDGKVTMPAMPLAFQSYSTAPPN